MPIKYIPFIPEPIEGQAVLGNFNRILKYKGADVIFDGGQGGACPAKHMYFLNTDYIYLRPHKDRNMKVIGGDRMAINQDALYRIIGWAGNMTLSNASLQGVLIGE